MTKTDFENETLHELEHSGKKPPYSKMDVIDACEKVFFKAISEMKDEYRLIGDLLNGEEASEVMDKYFGFLQK